MGKLNTVARQKSLGEVLVEANLISAEQLEDALELGQKQGRELNEILLEQSLVTSEDLAMIRSIQLNVPHIDLKRHVVQPDALRLIPEETARKYKLIPIDFIGDSLLVVMADPEDIRAIEDIQAQSKMRVEPALGIPSDIQGAINHNYRASAEIEKKVSQFASLVLERKEEQTAPDTLAQTPITQALDLLLGQAVKDRASDVHLEPQESRLRIRYRIDGILHDSASLPRSTHSPLISRLKILAGMDIAEQRRPQDGQFSIKVEGRDIDIRATTAETACGERVSLRILDKALSLFNLSELGLLPDTLKKYREMLRSSFGMILVGGPTGSGKTTTLYASINQLNRSELNIMTIEDPIEYHFIDINQIGVNPKAGITFANGLRTIMRHDPDVILVGEIRDRETANLAVQAALTGHLVLSSIHANDTIGVLFRLMDLGIEPYLISSTLVGIVAQRMVRRICPHCCVSHQPSLEERVAYEGEMGQGRATFHKGAGCNFCANTGYLGRTGVFEILIMSEEIKRMLLNQASAGEIRAQALKEGMVTMKHDGMLKVKEGITTPYEVLRSVFSIG